MTTRVCRRYPILPTLFYLLGHRPIRHNPLYGRPLLAETKEELDAYPQADLLVALDVRAVHGILSAGGRYLYTTYDSPAENALCQRCARKTTGTRQPTPPRTGIGYQSNCDSTRSVRYGIDSWARISVRSS